MAMGATDDEEDTMNEDAYETITVHDYATRKRFRDREVYIQTFHGLLRVRQLLWWPRDPWIVTREEGSSLTKSWCVHAGSILHAKKEKGA